MTRLDRALYLFFKTSIQFLALVFYRVRHYGQHNIPADGGVLVVSNHQSHFDPPLVGIGSWRRMNYVARDSLFRFPIFGRIIYAVGAIPIDRDGVGLAGIKESLKRLKHGEMVLIFPEGTRSRDGEIAKFRPGFTTLAVRSKSAILPAAVDGAYQAWPRSKKFPYLGRTIRVQYGKPILPADYAGMDEHALVAEVERRVRACQAELRAMA